MGRTEEEMGEIEEERGTEEEMGEIEEERVKVRDTVRRECPCSVLVLIQESAAHCNLY